MAKEPQTDTPGVRILPPFVYLGGLIIGYAIWWFWPVPVVPAEWSFAIRVTGGVAVVLGFWVMLSAVMAFRRIDEDPNPMEPTSTLTFDGPYRFTRNPMYVGMALILGGLALAGNALWPLVALVPVIWVIRTQVIAKEEHYLEAKFGGEYVAFKERVRRWL
jgi:protein-S-isoprenylcysteine O-methyltransferase Ste14